MPVKSFTATTGVPRSTVDAPGLRAKTRSSTAFVQSVGSAVVLFAVVCVYKLTFVQSCDADIKLFSTLHQPAAPPAMSCKGLALKTICVDSGLPGVLVLVSLS